jgi:hypothetical protein
MPGFITIPGCWEKSHGIENIVDIITPTENKILSISIFGDIKTPLNGVILFDDYNIL